MNPQVSDFQVVKDKSIYIKKKEKSRRNYKIINDFPIIAAGILTVLISGCIFARFIMNHDPSYMDLIYSNTAPNSTFYFGTDSMGRDIFSAIWYGGRISLFIGVFSSMISASIGVLYGSISGIASEWIDNCMMKFIDIVISIPSILLILFTQAMIGKNNPIGISIVIGAVSWMGIAKVVRSEVRQIRNSEYILAAKMMGGSFFYILRMHLIPNFASSIIFMMVSNIGTAIAAESTLSFLGIGLPIEIISWGSMLSLAQQALFSNYWWIIVIPGAFLVTTLVCIADIGDYLRRKNIKKHNNL